MMIDGVEIISVGYELTMLGTIIAVLITCGITACALEFVVYVFERRGDIALALAIACAVLIISFNPITKRFAYEKYTVKVSDSVTVSELTRDYVILEQKKDGTLVIREKKSDGKS